MPRLVSVSILFSRHGLRWSRSRRIALGKIVSITSTINPTPMNPTKIQPTKPQYYLLAEARFARNGDTSAQEATTQWHFLLEAADGSARLDIADEEPDTPSDRMELLALVRGLEAIDHPAQVSLVTPSRYVTHGLRFGLDQWRENGWQWEAFGQMAPVKNVDLWQRIDQALTIHRVECKTVRNDTPQVELAQPHKKPRESGRVTRRKVAVERRGTATTLASPVKHAEQKAGVWSTMRAGFAGMLHGLGEAVGPRQVSAQGG